MLDQRVKEVEGQTGSVTLYVLYYFHCSFLYHLCTVLYFVTIFKIMFLVFIPSGFYNAHARLFTISHCARAEPLCI